MVQSTLAPLQRNVVLFFVWEGFLFWPIQSMLYDERKGRRYLGIFFSVFFRFKKHYILIETRILQKSQPVAETTNQHVPFGRKSDF